MKLWLMETLIILGLVILGCQSEDTVDQPLKYVTKFEGESVTLDCKYTTTSTTQELFWYIQRTDQYPKLVLQRNSYGGGSNGTEFQERFYSEDVILWRVLTRIQEFKLLLKADL
ncbi:hypothetical protein G5714_002013 [Onychostoma macrolepis]|uniref:Immunoglobulin V-set domain-containing protein n=1 Tax=Onychostoma macrolepis TaxID=369639 RepID=A0A7J6DE05_9TELE|nr:hypothetical protein G5714_002013 [Onychostoma macrolepis]